MTTMLCFTRAGSGSRGNTSSAKFRGELSLRSRSVRKLDCLFCLRTRMVVIADISFLPYVGYVTIAMVSSSISRLQLHFS